MSILGTQPNHTMLDPNGAMVEVAFAAPLGGPAGRDAIGDRLVRGLAEEGVDCAGCVRARQRCAVPGTTAGACRRKGPEVTGPAQPAVADLATPERGDKELDGAVRPSGTNAFGLAVGGGMRSAAREH